MTDRIIPTLGISCGALTILYIGLMISTIFFAAWQTQSVSTVNNLQSQIGNLENNYYTLTSHISQINPTSVGFVEPSQVQYVAEANNASAGLTFAGN
ncbi:MAG: hypothetical protein P4M11_09595 [Candidatus Pacebacteria bacterium]|nr:hypothetical protein [Candidatus Paceibacterota bacterium]